MKVTIKPGTFLLGILALSVCSHSATANAKDRKDITVVCVASDGLTLTIPDPSEFYMQPVDLQNDYDPNFLQNLIDRKGHPKTTDKNLHMNVSFGDCTREGLKGIHCRAPNAFGNASYGYIDGNDAVTVDTGVAGTLDLDLTVDANGIYQMKLTQNNTKLGSAHRLVIEKGFGPINDPAKTSLTPWSPGCSLPEAR